jgi:hypothetical protein
VRNRVPRNPCRPIQARELGEGNRPMTAIAHYLFDRSLPSDTENHETSKS